MPRSPICKTWPPFYRRPETKTKKATIMQTKYTALDYEKDRWIIYCNNHKHDCLNPLNSIGNSLSMKKREQANDGLVKIYHKHQSYNNKKTVNRRHILSYYSYSRTFVFSSLFSCPLRPKQVMTNAHLYCV